jgi:poly-gamma-glutamate synthesis protein (capsule biosynthesis protein)
MSYSSPSRSSSVTIVAVGDTNGYNILQDDRNQGDPLQEVRGLLKDNDVFIFNFEGVLLPNEPPPGICRRFPRQSLFYTFPWIASFLRPTQFTIATLANNHILDCGSYGIQETIRELVSRKILTVGAGKNSEQACKPVRLQVNGFNLAVVAYLAMKSDWLLAESNGAGSASWEKCVGERQLAELKASEDIIVVSLHLHLGTGWTKQSPPAHIALVRRILAAGADVVIAHGPHVPQGILQNDGQLALLSLGNFLFRPDYRMPREAHHSIMAKVTVSPNSFDLILLPLILDASGKPRVPSSQEAFEILRDVATLSAEFGTTVEIRRDKGYVTVRRRQ